MEYSASLEMSESYFAESFEQWLTHVSKIRKWEVHIGVFVFVAGAAALLYTRNTVFGVAVIFGLVQIVDFFIYRRKWIRQRLGSRGNALESPVEIRVSEEGLYQKGPTSEGTVSWEGVKAALPTPKGLFIAIGDGMSVYIPDASMHVSEFKNFVVKMVAGDT